MPDEPISGAKVYAQYGWETTFGTEAGTIDKPFGINVSITPAPKNNLIEVLSLGNRNVQKLLGGKYEGAVNITFTMANPDFLRAVFGAVADAETDPTIHTYTEADTIDSMTVEIGYNLGSDDVVRKLLGTKIVRATLSCAAGEEVKVNLECLYQKEADLGSTLDSSIAIESASPFVFQQGTVTFPSITNTVANVQNIEMVVDNGLIPQPNLNQRFPAALLEGARKYSGTVSHTLETGTANSTLIQTGTGTEEVPENTSIQMLFANSGTGSTFRRLNMVLGDVKIDSDSIPATPNELVVEDVPWKAEELDECTAADNVSSSP